MVCRGTECVLTSASLFTSLRAFRGNNWSGRMLLGDGLGKPDILAMLLADTLKIKSR